MSEDDSVKHEGKWTRDDLPSVIKLNSYAGMYLSRLRELEEYVDVMLDHLNAHYPKPQPYDQGGVRGADSLLYRAERERDAAVARADNLDKQLAKIMSDYQDIEDERDELKKHLKATEEVLDIERKQHEETGDNLVQANQRWLAAIVERDEWKARAEAAERELADEYSEANQKAAAWDRIRAHPALRRNLLPDVEGSYADLVFERVTWLAEVAETVTELQSAPAVSRDDIEKAIRYEFLDWEGQWEARISRAVNQTWNLVSDSDPAVHVVRESDLPAARVDGDYYVAEDPKGDYRWPKHGASWWEDRAQDALTKAARFTALALLAADREADPVEEKAREMYRAATPGARWETVADEYRRIARHVLGQEADQ